MKSILITILLIISINSQAGAYFGIAQGYHLNGEQINDTHPYVGFQYKNVGVLSYLNSFAKIGNAAYYEFENKDGYFKFTTKVGVTTGYHPKMQYKSHTYSLDQKFFFNDDVMFLIIPGVSFEDNGVSVDLTLLGDSLNLGFTVRI